MKGLKKFLLQFYCVVSFFIAQCCYAQDFINVSYIREIKPYLANCDHNSLVIFDIDNTISAPKDLLGRPKARKVRRKIFKNYKKNLEYSELRKFMLFI